MQSQSERPSLGTVPWPLEAIWSRQGGDVALTFARRKSSVDVTVEELRSEILDYAIFLKESGVEAAERVVLAFPEEREQVVSFLASLYIGAVPCLVAPLERSTNAALKALGGRTVLTTRDLACRSDSAVLSRPPGRFTGKLDATARSPEQDLYIQFSSGTSATPKGARISTFALQAQIGALRELCRFGRDEVSVSWLPLHHDLGLVLHLLTPLTQGFRAVLLRPAQWLRRPQTLFRALTTYRGTVCCMPPSAFEYALRHVQPGP